MKKNLQQCSIMVLACCLGFASQGQVLASFKPDKEHLAHRAEQTDRRTLKSVLKDLESRFKVSIAYKSELVENKEVSFSANNYKSLEEALNQVLSPVSLKYKKTSDDFYIIVASKETSTLQKIDNLQLLASTNNNLHLENINLISSLERSSQLQERNQAAPINVRGRVKDDTGSGLPGVNVLVKGTATGTTTDANGDYSLTAPDANGTLTFSYIGYTTEEVPINNRSVIDVTLVTDIQSLSEVVVVGYGTQKRETLTGSVTSVKGAELAQTPTTNVSNTLSGRLAGVVAVTRSGEPGADGSTIRIRGLNTLGDNNPLVVVDGIPGRSLDRIDPNSIETMTVLKDASAAIYGAQAANGVILITTKRGKVGKPEIQLNLNQGYGRPTRLPEMANATEYATMLNEIDLYKGIDPRYTPEDLQKFSDGSDPWKYPNTDWYKEVIKPWSGQNYSNITINGGGENLRYFLLLGAKGQDGYYKNSATKFTQYDFRSNLDGKISDHVNIGFDLAGRQENRNYPTRGANSIFRMVMRGKPHMHAYWPNGTPGPDIEYGDNPAVVSTDATGYDRDTWYVLNSNLKLNVNIPWVKGLSITSNAGIDKGFRFRKRFETPWFLYSWDGQTYGVDGQPVLVKGKKGFDDPRLSQDTEFNQNILINGFINYETSIADIHNIKFMVGGERRTGQGDRFNAYRRFFVSTAVDQLFAGGERDMLNGGSAFQSARLNYFGRVNYNFLEKYLVEFVWRYDGSYIFPENKRYGFFPGISAGWRISEEGFFKDNVAFVNNLKIRGSWGQTGNDRIAEYQYLSSYAYGRFDATGNYDDSYRSPFMNESYIFGIDQENKALYEALIPNRNVTWEVANQSNIGFEAQLLDNKISLEADYFYNRRSEILIKRNASIPGSTGLTLPRENIGKVANQGFDFSVGYNNNIGDFNYQVNLNAGYAINKILFWDEAAGVPSYQQSTGSPMFTDVFYEATGIFRDEEQVNNTPHFSGARPGDIIFRDVNNDGTIDANDRVRSKYNDIPRWNGGLNLNMQFKGFDLAILFQGAAGAVQYVSTESGEIGNFLKSFYDQRWTAENPNASGPRTFNRDNEYWRNNRNTHFLHKTDYIRLKNLQLGYTLPLNVSKKVGMQGVRFYVSGFNLLTYSPDFKDFDPESNNASGQGYPLQKVFNGGLTLTF